MLYWKRRYKSRRIRKQRHCLVKVWEISKFHGFVPDATRISRDLNKFDVISLHGIKILQTKLGIMNISSGSDQTRTEFSIFNDIVGLSHVPQNLAIFSQRNNSRRKVFFANFIYFGIYEYDMEFVGVMKSLLCMFCVASHIVSGGENGRRKQEGDRRPGSKIIDRLE